MDKYLKYRTPDCPCCGANIATDFTFHLEARAAMPGVAGQYGCPKCGHQINYILAQSVVVDVLPYSIGVDMGRGHTP